MFFKIFLIKETILNNDNVFYFLKNTLLKDVDLNALYIEYDQNFKNKVFAYKEHSLIFKNNEFTDYMNNLTVEDCLKIYDNLWVVDDVAIDYKVANYYIQKDSNTFTHSLNDNSKSFVEFLKKENTAYNEILNICLFNMRDEEYEKNSLNNFSYYDAKLFLTYKYFSGIGFDKLEKDHFDIISYTLNYIENSTMSGDHHRAFVLYYLMDHMDIMDIIQLIENFVTAEQYEFIEDDEFINYVNSYDEYKELPVSWCLELV